MFEILVHSTLPIILIALALLGFSLWAIKKEQHK